LSEAGVLNQAAIADRLLPLIEASLRAWRISGEVVRASDGAVLIQAGTTRLRVTAPPPGLPFRYLVIIGERERGVTSIAGLLRALHGALDPQHGASRLRFAARPVLTR